MAGLSRYSWVFKQQFKFVLLMATFVTFRCLINLYLNWLRMYWVVLFYSKIAEIKKFGWVTQLIFRVLFKEEEKSQPEKIKEAEIMEEKEAREEKKN